jgi:hypothetical protein
MLIVDCEQLRQKLFSLLEAVKDGVRPEAL